MPSVANVIVHSSQFPDAIRRDLLKSLRTRKVNHKFHYDSVKQTQKWLALHEAYSPARKDRGCLSAYSHAFAAVAHQIPARQIQVIGLGCGGGQKDVQLLRTLRKAGRDISYVACDVSAAMTLVARKAAMAVVPGDKCCPFVCDLATGKDLRESLPKPKGRAHRIITFFGMIPNFEPRLILPRLAGLLNTGDTLLFSANLAPGKDYSVGMEKILPQYSNTLTSDWLMTFLYDLGVEKRDGKLRFSIEDGEMGLKRVVARFHFSKRRATTIEEEIFSFAAGESIQLFFSYRYTPELVRAVLAEFRLQVEDQWITKSQEEGVFLCRKN
jgi:L-histidine N-alpha-methyltransferase